MKSTSTTDPIALFVPGAGTEERTLRLRIHRARDVATARATRSKHWRARQLYWWAAELASDWVFRRAPNEELSDVLAALARMFLTAGLVERQEEPDASEWIEGAAA